MRNEVTWLCSVRASMLIRRDGVATDFRYDNAYAYDPNGNTISRTETRHPPGKGRGIPPAPKVDIYSFTWDYENRLVGYDAPGPSKDSTYVYYADWWNRTAKTVNRRTERYLYDGDEILCDYDKNGNLKALYVNGPIIDERLAMLHDGQLYYYLTDHLGSVRLLIDTAGNIKNSYDYEAFGSTLSRNESVSNSYLYTGRNWGLEIGQYYFRWRFYEPSVGRFTAHEPGESARLSGGYTYAANRPLVLRDPTGREVPLIAGGGVVAEAGAAAGIGAGTIVGAVLIVPGCLVLVAWDISIGIDIAKTKVDCQKNHPEWPQCPPLGPNNPFVALQTSPKCKGARGWYGPYIYKLRGKGPTYTKCQMWGSPSGTRYYVTLVYMSIIGEKEFRQWSVDCCVCCRGIEEDQYCNFEHVSHSEAEPWPLPPRIR